jgi:hypothetical protein
MQSTAATTVINVSTGTRRRKGLSMQVLILTPAVDSSLREAALTAAKHAQKPASVKTVASS